MHPQPRVQGKRAHELQSPQVHRNSPAFPARRFTTYSVLSPAIGLCVTVAGAMRKHCRQLHASVEALRPHGFVVRFMRARPSRQSVHRIPYPTFVTIAIRHSNGNGTTGITNAVSTKVRSEIFFARGLAPKSKSAVRQPRAFHTETFGRRTWPDNAAMVNLMISGLTATLRSHIHRYPLPARYGCAQAPRSIQ